MLLTVCEEVLGPYGPNAKTWRADIFPKQIKQTRNIYYMANVFKYERSSKQTLLKLQVHSTRRCLRVNVYKEFLVTVHNFQEFENS